MRLVLLICLGIIFSGCEKRKTNSNIFKQGYFISNNNDRINTYYIYDFICPDKIKNHASQTEYSKGRVTTNFYFSHNGNIPSQELKLANSLSEAYRIVNDYSLYIKYIYEKNSFGEIEFVDCSQLPKDDRCVPKKQ